MPEFSRRSLLRGMLGGAAVSIGVPLLDCFLNEHGDALAQGAPLPLRFGTWFWGCGVNPDRWVPEADGADFQLPVELAALEPLRGQFSVLSGFNVVLDGSPNEPHVSGMIGTLTGSAPTHPTDIPSPTFDTAIAEQLSAGVRFRSLELSATGFELSYSRISESIINPSETSPIALYARVFGDDFHDPADGAFMPDPRLALRQSVLSAVSEDRARLDRTLGARDRQRMDQYYTSLRQLEKQLEVLASGPPLLEACARPESPEGETVGTDVSEATATHAAMADLLALALACDQTRVFNVAFSQSVSDLRETGSNLSHHQLTHDEPLTEALGYQPKATEFVLASMEAWGTLLSRLAAVPEGDGTLLDNCCVFAHSDTSLAKSHDVTNLPLMVAGRAGGRLVPGLHVRGNGGPVSRVALTLQQVMGLNLERFGTLSMEVSNPVSEIVV